MSAQLAAQDPMEILRRTRKAGGDPAWTNPVHRTFAKDPFAVALTAAQLHTTVAWLAERDEAECAIVREPDDPARFELRSATGAAQLSEHGELHHSATSEGVRCSDLLVKRAGTVSANWRQLLAAADALERSGRAWVKLQSTHSPGAPGPTLSYRIEGDKRGCAIDERGGRWQLP